MGRLEDIYGRPVGGMVTGSAADQLGTSESPLCQNIDPSAPTGAATRKGSAFYASHAAGSGFIGTGLGPWTRNAATTYVFVSFGTSIISVESLGTVTTVKLGINSDTYMGFAALNNLGVLVAASMAPQVSTAGSTLAALGGTPPSLARYVAVYAAKCWLAGDPSKPTKLSFSASNNPEDYTTANNAGNITIGDSGDVIRGLEGTKRALYVFMRRSVYVVTGDSPFNFRVDRLADIGLVSEWGHATDGQGAFFASDDGIYYVSGYNIARVSDKNRNVYVDIADKTTVVLEVKNDKLFIAYKNAGSQNDTLLVLAYKRKMADGRVDGVWSQYTSQPYQALKTSRGSNLYALTNASSLQIYEIDTGTSGAVTGVWYTPHYDFGDPTGIKALMRTYFQMSAPTGTTTLSVTPIIDGASSGSAYTLTSATSTASYVMLTIPGQITTSLAKVHLGLRIEWTGNFKMQAYRMVADVRTDEPPRRVS